MNLKKSPISSFKKVKRELKYTKGFYNRRIQAEIESNKDSDDKDIRDTTNFKIYAFWIESQFS